MPNYTYFYIVVNVGNSQVFKILYKTKDRRAILVPEKAEIF